MALEQLKTEFLNSPEFEAEILQAPKKPDFAKYMEKQAPDFDFNGFAQSEYKTYPKPELNEKEQIKAMKDRSFVNEHYRNFMANAINLDFQIPDPGQTQTIILIDKIRQIIDTFKRTITKDESTQDKAPERYANMVIFELKKIRPEWITRTKESILSEIKSYNIEFYINKDKRENKYYQMWDAMVLEFSQIIEAFEVSTEAMKLEKEIKAFESFFTTQPKDVAGLKNYLKKNKGKAFAATIEILDQKGFIPENIKVESFVNSIFGVNPNRTEYKAVNAFTAKDEDDFRKISHEIEFLKDIENQIIKYLE